MIALLSLKILAVTCVCAASVSLTADPLDDRGRGEPSRQCAGTTEFASGNGIVVRVGHGGGILTSKEGAVWDEQRLGIRTFVRSVTFGRGIFVAVGGSYVDVPGIILTSSDGVTWVRRNPQNKINLRGIACGNGLFVTAGDLGTIFSSSDGICWTKRCSGTSAALAAVAFGNGIFVAGGESGTILTSTNGVHWTGRNLDNSVYVGKILFHDGLFLVTNSDATFTSLDGQVWLHREAETVKIP